MGPKTQRTLRYLLPALLFFACYFVYWHSVPDTFNTTYENRRFFDSDGEFITRQYRQGSVFTHNDHLLYHVLASLLDGHGHIPGIRHDPVRIHKFLSVFFGAAGVTALYVLGVLFTRRRLLSLLAAGLVGGTAGWWFFSATIDTYIPCLFTSVLALGFAILAIHDPRPRTWVLLGCAVGVSFLFRTDGVLLLPLGIVLFRHKEHLWRNVCITAAAGIACGIVAYALLARFLYFVPWQDLHAWAAGSLLRPEARDEQTWGVAGNLSPQNIRLALVNQFFYTVLMPGLAKTRDPALFQAYRAGGFASLGLVVVTALVGLAQLRRAAAESLRRKEAAFLFIPAFALLWVIPRTLFYAWWDPHDPFLFAVMSVPALWLVLLFGFRGGITGCSSQTGRVMHLCLLGLAAVAVWWHNLHFMIIPLRNL